MILRTALVISPLLSLGVVAAHGQEPRPRVSAGLGVAVYDGVRSESGLGGTASVQVSLTPLDALTVSAEAGAAALAAAGQVCTLGVPSGCSPADPASPMWHLRIGLSPRLAALPVYLTVGLGVYGPVGPADDASAAAGIDGGIGLRLSRRLALEAAYLHLRNGQAVGSAIPITLRLHF